MHVLIRKPSSFHQEFVWEAHNYYPPNSIHLLLTLDSSFDYFVIESCYKLEEEVLLFAFNLVLSVSA